MSPYYKILAGQQLYNDFYGFGEHPKDPTLFDRLKYLSVNEMEKETHIIAVTNGKVVGDVGLQVNPYDNSVLWFKHVVVDADHRNQGIAKKLIELTLEYCIHKNMQLEISSFSEDGKSYLTDMLIHIHKEIPDLIIPNRDMDEFLQEQANGLRL